MPKSVKFLKDLIRNRKELENVSKVTLNDQWAKTIMKEIPTKMSDPGSLTIPCKFGNSKKMNALADLGSSINLMQYSFYQKLNLSKLKSVRISIHMENKSVTYAHGIIED